MGRLLMEEKKKMKPYGISLSEVDKEAIKNIKKQFGHNTDAETIRFCIQMVAKGNFVLFGESLVITNKGITIP